MQIEQRIDLGAALRTLTDRQRAALYAVEVLGYSQEDVGDALGISQQAVARMNARSLCKLRAYCA